MRLKKARVRKYRSIRDTDWFDVEDLKTILVGPNEAGKTVLLQALRQINPPEDLPGFTALRDYPRSEYNDISTGKVDPKQVTVVEAHFQLEPQDIASIPSEFAGVTYVRTRRLDNSAMHWLEGGPSNVKFSDIKKDLLRLATHADARVPNTQGEEPAGQPHRTAIHETTKDWEVAAVIHGDRADRIKEWLEETLPSIEEGSEEEKRYDRLIEAIGFHRRQG